MGKAIVATRKVSDISATLTDLLTRLPFGDPKYYLLHRPDDITDWTKGSPDTEAIEQFTYGRLFGNKGELRWQKANGGYTLLWLSEGELPDGFTKRGDWITRELQSIHLLGGGETEPWRDTRIPRELNYPMEWCESPQVQVIQYMDLHSQTIRFTRYTEFVK